MVKKELGQYFTKSEELQQKVLEFIKNNGTFLEPSCGRGDIVKSVEENLKVSVDCYEIDEEIDFIINKTNIVFGDFLQQKIEKKYNSIVGNPPYVRTKKGNLYIDFTDKCYELLEENGELIFIIPSDFFKLTSSKKLISKMLKNGTFTDIYHPKKENYFEEASVDVLIYRYCKNKELPKTTIYNGVSKNLVNNNGIITFQDSENNGKTIGDLFEVYVGMVSGKEDIYKNNTYGNIEVLNDKDKKDKYIFITEFPSTNENINEYLKENETQLRTRKIIKINDNNWFKWGAPRNIKIMENFKGEDCIYVKNLTRNKVVCFEGTIDYYGGSLIMLKPKTEEVKESIPEIVKIINNDSFKKNYMYSGRFKIGHRQLVNANI